ncbi:MAG: diguanylate cyclase (GGDEF)-like protein [Oleiphilaceae bacterium]
MSIFSTLWRISPFLIVVLSYLLVDSEFLNLIDVNVLRAMPYLMGFVLFCFASMFNRSRFVAPIVITLFVYWFIRSHLQSPLSEPSTESLFIGINVLFCAQLIMSALMPEKGLVTRTGFAFLLILGLGNLALLLWGSESFVIATWQSITLPTYFIFTENYWLTSLILLCHSTTVLVLALCAIWKRSAAEYALLLTWFVGFIVFVDFATPEVSSLGFTSLLLALFILFQQSNYQVTYMDALTGIPSRRSMEDYLPTLSKRYAIAMLDVDHFKKFNDTYGHDVGDQVLKMVASRIHQVAGGGKAFRYGGEEFMVIFNRSDANACYVFLEAVRESIQHYQMTLRGDDREQDKQKGTERRTKAKKVKPDKMISVTISIGIANSAQGLSRKEVIKLADENLYKAKQTGRNCTVRPDH